MSNLRELYQELIIDHQRKPRNFRKMEDADHKADGYNPLCGDRITIYLKINEELIIEDISFEGAGCAICTASGSLMTQAIKGMSIEKANALFQRFHSEVMNEEPDDSELKLGKLEALAGVKDFPVRIKCATLPWHTFKAALEGQADAVKTE